MAIPSYIDFDGLQATGVATLTPDIATFLSGNSPQDGDLLLCHLYVEGVSATAEYELVAPPEWHRLCSSQNDNTSAIFWKIWRTGDDTTPTFSGWPAGDSICVIHLIRGADEARPIVRHSINRDDNDLINWLPETTPVADCLALATAGMADNKAGQTPASGWTERVDTDVGNMMMYSQTQGFASASTSTGNPVVDTFGDDPYSAHMLLIQEPQTPTPRDIRVKTGSSTSPTSTGNQDITGLGFDVKALIVYCANKGDDSVTANFEYMRGIGADDGVTSAAQRSAGVWHTSGGTTDQGYSDNGSIIKMYFQGNTTLGSPDLQATYSRITDGFRLNWTAVQGSGVVFNWIAIGGDDVEAVVGAEQVSTSPVSGLPWRPDLVHTMSQCLDSDSDQIRDIGLLSSGWIDCQAGAQFAMMLDLDAGEDMFIVRHQAFIGQGFGGVLTWEAGFRQTNSDGWSWHGSNTDYFWYLALHFQNDTAFPYQVETLDVSAAGASGDDETLPPFADGQTFGEKQVVHILGADGGNSVVQELGGVSEGHVEFDGGDGFVRDQDVLAVARAGNTSERRRKLAAAFLLANVGDLGTPGKTGEFVDEDTVNWSANVGGGFIVGLATIGFIGQEYAANPQDTVAATDAVSIEMEYGRAVSDAAAVTDAVAREHDAARPLSDSVDATDATSTTVEIALTDAVGVTDDTTPEFAAGGVNVDDTAAVTDAVTAEMDFGRAASDAVSVVDAVATELEFGRSASDSVDVTDDTQREHDAARVASDSVDVADAASATVEITLADSVAVTDAVAREGDANRTNFDSVAVVDQVSVEAATALADSVAVAEQTTVATDYNRAASDTAVVTDAVVAELELSRSATDAVAVTDAVATEADYNRAVTDTADVTDATARSLEAERSASDTVAVADEAVGERVIVIADVVAVTDAIAREHDASRTISDSVAAADAIMAEAEGLFTVDASDTVDITDATSAESQYARAASDTATTTDAVTAELGFERAAVDTASVTDAVAAERELGRSASDAVATTDATAREHDASRTASDTVAVVDDTAVEAGANIVVSDTIAVTDAAAREHDASRTVSDTADVTDATLVGFDRSRSASDAAAVTDAVAVELEFERAASDAAVVTDATQREADTARSISDAVVVVDATATGQEFLITVADTAATTDAIATTIEYERLIADAPAVTDAIAREHDAARTISDSVAVADVTFAGEIAITLSDSVAVTDVTAREHDASRSVSDAVVAADTATPSVVPEIAASDAIAVTDATAREAEFARSAVDAAAVVDAVEVLFITPNVVITDTIEVTDTVNGSLEVAATPADALDVVDVIDVVLTLGASANDNIGVTDSVTADILNLDPDLIDVVDQVVRSVEYNRSISDAVAANDLVIEGEPQVYAETIDGGVVVGGVDAYTVSPFGPVSASGGPDCVTAPIGFVVETGDQVSCTDSFQAGLECHIVLSDVVAVAEV